MTTDPLDLLAALRLDNGRRWGEVATDWQIADAGAILTPTPDDPLQHWLGRPKGGSKTTDVAGIAVVWLLTQSEPLDEGYVVASDRDQAARLLTFADGLIRRSGLGNRLEVQRGQIVNRATDAKVIALAADAPGAEGILSPLILVDELPQWPDNKAAVGMWTAAYSSIPKRAGMRFVVIGHAGVEGSFQHKYFKLAVGSDLWRVNDVPGPLPWVDERVLADQRLVLSDSQYARRHLNQWSTGDDVLVTVDDLRACVTLDGPLRPVAGEDYVIAVDLGLKSDRTVAVVCHLEGEVMAPTFEATGERARMAEMLHRQGVIGYDELLARRAEEAARVIGPASVAQPTVVLDRIETWQGSRKAPVRIEDVEAWVLQAHASFNRADVVLDPWQAIGMAQRLRERAVAVEEFTFSSSSVGRLASTLQQVLRGGSLALPDDEELLDELAHVRLVERTPGVVRMDHDSGRHDDRALALALAAQQLLSRPPRARPVMEVAHDGRGAALSRGR